MGYNTKYSRQPIRKPKKWIFPDDMEVQQKRNTPPEKEEDMQHNTVYLTRNGQQTPLRQYKETEGIKMLGIHSSQPTGKE
eukprot:8576048-Ditylum_brightwellii.AAC.1